MGEGSLKGVWEGCEGRQKVVYRGFEIGALLRTIFAGIQAVSRHETV